MTDALPAKIEPQKTTLSLEIKHGRPLTSCHWAPQSQFVFFGAQDNLVHRLGVSSKSVVSLAGHDSWVRAFGSSLDGDVLYTGGYDGRLGFWPANADKPEPIRMCDAHQGWVRAIAVSPNGKQIASCGNDQCVKLWDATTGTLVREFRGHQSHVYNLAFLPGGSSLVSCDQKGVVNSWSLDTDEPRELLTVDALHTYDTTFRADIGGARSLALCSQGDRLALGGISKVTNAFAGVGETAIALVNLGEGKLERVLQSKDKHKGTMWGVAHHPSGFWIGLSGGGGGGWLTFWKDDAEHEFFKLKLKNDGRGMSLSPDRKQLVVAHADMHLRTYTLHGAA